VLLAAVLKRLLGGVKNVFIVKHLIIQSEWVSELTEAKSGNALIVVDGLCCRNIAANNSLYATHLEGSFRVVLYFFSLIISTLKNNFKISLKKFTDSK
jgi:hypothetical protein